MFKNLIFLSLILLSFHGFAMHPGVVTGNEYLKIKDYQKAYDTYSKVLVENAKDQDALYGKSYALFKMKKYKDALDSFEILLSINSNYRDALYRTAFLYRKIKNYDKAITYYKRYLKVKQDDPDTYYGLARTHEQKNEKVYATYYFYMYTIKEKRASEKKWVKKAEKKVENYKAKFSKEELAQYEALIQPKKEAKPVVVTTIAVKETAKPNKTGSKASTVVKKEQLNIPKATTKNTKTTSTDKNLNYMFMKGVKGDDLYLKQEYKKAISEYRTYLTQPLKRREGLYKMAICHALLKEYPKAVTLLSQMVIEETDNNQVRELLKLLLMNKAVVQSLKEATPSMKNRIGMKKVNTLIARGDYFEAIKVLDILIETIKENSHAVLYKVDLLRILSQTKKIEETLKAFLTQHPEHVIVNEKYADFLVSQKRNEEAKTYYQVALSKTKDSEIKSRLEKKMTNK